MGPIGTNSSAPHSHGDEQKLPHKSHFAVAGEQHVMASLQDHFGHV